MRCPHCAWQEDKVVDSRSNQEGDVIRRRRECLKCQRRFTTYEHIEQAPLMIIKKDGRREPFDKKKILTGVIKACEKRPVSMDKKETMVEKIERYLQKNYEKEVKSREIGELVMKRLHNIDEVAYVRFASVYREFKDLSQFMKELKQMLK
jgi:transcriptional repressor NrdR